MSAGGAKLGEHLFRRGMVTQVSVTGSDPTRIKIATLGELIAVENEDFEFIDPSEGLQARE